MRRLTVCILEGEPKLPKSVKVVAGISGTWNDQNPLSLGMNLAMNINFLRSELEKQYKCKIPLMVIDGGRSITLTPELVHKLWEAEHHKDTFHIP